MKLTKPEVEWQYWGYFVASQYDMDVGIKWRKGAERSIVEG